VSGDGNLNALDFFIVFFRIGLVRVGFEIAEHEAFGERFDKALRRQFAIQAQREIGHAFRLQLAQDRAAQFARFGRAELRL